jgi:hypothetical protein
MTQNFTVNFCSYDSLNNCMQLDGADFKCSAPIHLNKTLIEEVVTI